MSHSNTWSIIRILGLVPILAVMATSSLAAEDCKGAGRIDGILINGNPSFSPHLSEVFVLRLGIRLTVENGMPLCYGDEIQTGKANAVIIRLGHPDNESEFTLYENTTIQLIDDHTLSFIIGRFFASLHGIFDVRTSTARLGARGTKFRLETNLSETNVTQLEGSLEIRVAATPEVSPLVLKPLNQLRYLNSAITPGVPTVASVKACREITHVQSAAIASSRPEIRADSQEAADGISFQGVFRKSICDPEQDSYLALGDAYSAWGEGTKALLAYEKAIGTKPRTTDAFANYLRLGNAYRLAGLFDKARESLLSAESMAHHDIPSDWSDVLNDSLGSLYYDIADMQAQQGNLSAAEDLLKTALSYYSKIADAKTGAIVKPRDSSTYFYRPRAMGLSILPPPYGVAKIFLRLGRIKATRTDSVEEAQVDYQSALDNLKTVLARHPNYSPATIARAQVAAAQARIYESLGQHEKVDEALKRARDDFERLRQDRSTYGPALLAYGQFLRDEGHTEKALSYFRRAVRSDPELADAYFETANCLDELGHEQALIFYETYLQMTPESLSRGQRAERATHRVGDIKGTVRTVPMLLNLTLDEALELLEQGHFKVEELEEPSESPKDTVTRQIPVAGTRRLSGAKITIFLSSGPTPSSAVVVPDVVGSTTTEGQAKLANVGLTSQLFESDRCEPGESIVFQWPPPGNRIRSHGPVYLYTGTIALSEIPDVTGLQVKEAESDDFILMEWPYENNTVEPGVIFKQNPDAGQVEICGSWVFVHYRR
jgi:tetratricopeptide (TPR) repeat protein